MVTLTPKGNTTSLGATNKDKIAEFNKVQAELKELDLLISTNKINELRSLNAKMVELEEKSNCGSIRLLDRLANFFEFSVVNVSKKLATKIRSLTVKIHGPCSIPFTKKK